MDQIKVFLSSPTDVQNERDAVERVAQQINNERPGRPQLKLFRWEDFYYTADKSFQEGIPRASQCDLVICIFWARIGSELPDLYRRPDGTTPTGSEYEFE